LLLIENAYDQGMISEELYPDKSALRKLLARDARHAWPAFYDQLLEFQSVYRGGENPYRDRIRQTPIGLEEISAADFLAFSTIWQAMKLIKLSLESKEIYVNHKPLATEQFLDEFNDYKECALVKELQDRWTNWHITTFNFEEARESADRLMNLAADLQDKHFNI
jgi:hypothetical protein